MAPLMRFEKIERPIGPKDVQIHKKSMVDQMDILLREACLEAARDYPEHTYNGYTYEITPDGAGVKHYNLTVYFRSHEVTLNPRNLNNTPTRMFDGKVLDEAELVRQGIGQYDMKWKGF